MKLLNPKKRASKSEIKTIVRNGLKRADDSGAEKLKLLLPKNETIIEMLQITKEEQKELKTIIDKDTKLKRFNDTRKAKRRNAEGLTSREKKKQDLIKAVQKLKGEGFNNTEIAKKVGISVRYARQIINSYVADI